MVNNDESLNFSKTGERLSIELQDYFRNKFCLKNNGEEALIDDDGFVDTWTAYCTEAVEVGTMDVLIKCYPQLNFPIEQNIDKSEKYRNAVLKGHYVENNKELSLINSEGIKLNIYNSIAGKIPVIEIPNELDFITIVQCLLYKNNPTAVPLSMGALMVNGINNWDRINVLKKEWSASIQGDFLTKIQENPNLFKDKLILLSKKPYSNISAQSLKLDSNDWLSLSYAIRLEHECTHLYTLKKYGSASNNLHDELVADYIGISTALGSFNKNWMLAFLGLENFPNYRKGARLENYITALNLSSEGFDKLVNIIYRAIENISLFDGALGCIQSIDDQRFRINALCETDVLAIASPKGKDMLLNRYKQQSFIYE